ncbi:MAG: TolC family protein, partial [Planctomycetota bacterium]
AIACASAAIARRSAATRRLGALIGSNDPVHRGVAADPKTMVAQLEYGAVLADLLASSPELAERFTEIQKARCEVSYQRSLATPDLNTQLIAQYDDATGDAIAGVQIGGPLVLWNRNQGAIGRAQAELTAAKRRLDRLEQSLEQRLADAFGRYEAAKSQVEALQDDVLPRAEESLELATAGYEAGEIGFLDLLTVQRTYFVASLESLRSLRELNETVQRIRGRLIDAAPSAGVRLN